MSKANAADMIPYGLDMIGTPYSAMDCQAFIEYCLRCIGIKKDLPGSNAWFRAMDWTGTPEECKATFGSIPPGAFLFILQEESNSEPAKYRGDGIGDACHIGLYTARGEGAVHSSQSRGCVAESKFKGKSISGGWNRVGLWTSALEYWGGGKEADGLITRMVVTAENGGTVKMRQKPNTNCSIYINVPVGAVVDVYSERDGWANIQYAGQNGYMMSDFLAPLPDDTPTAPEPSPRMVTITLPDTVAQELLAALLEAKDTEGEP